MTSLSFFEDEVAYVTSDVRPVAAPGGGDVVEDKPLAPLK
jgi:hypothetical protein